MDSETNSCSPDSEASANESPAIESPASEGPVSKAHIDKADNWFSRDCLLDTVRLLRKNNPSLALRIQNLLMQPVAEINGTDSTPQHIQLQLDGFTLKRVVDSLAELGNDMAREVLENQAGNHEELIIMRDVIGKWLQYARFHREEVARRQELDDPAVL